MIRLSWTSMKLFCLYHIFKSFCSGLLDKQFNGTLSLSRGRFRGSHLLLWARQCNVQQTGRFASRADEVKITYLDVMQDWEKKAELFITPLRCQNGTVLRKCRQLRARVKSFPQRMQNLADSGNVAWCGNRFLWSKLNRIKKISNEDFCGKKNYAVTRKNRYCTQKLSQLQRFTEAEAALSEANQIDNRNATVWKYLCLLNMSLERHDEFAQCYGQIAQVKSCKNRK